MKSLYKWLRRYETIILGLVTLACWGYMAYQMAKQGPDAFGAFR
jgi:hypothetical protein